MLEKIKWLATFTLIVGSFVNAAGWAYGPHVLIFGGMIWLTASLMMKDKPLIITNSVMSLAGVLGLMIR